MNGLVGEAVPVHAFGRRLGDWFGNGSGKKEGVKPRIAGIHAEGEESNPGMDSKSVCGGFGPHQKFWRGGLIRREMGPGRSCPGIWAG